jgi:hypothetical protein
VQLISSPLHVPNQIQVPATGWGGLESKIHTLRSKRFDLFQHQPCSRNRNGFGRNRRKTRRDQVGIYKIRAVRVVRQKFAGESSLTRSVGPAIT